MSVELISEDEIRAALRPYRPDAATFEAKVRERLVTLPQEEGEDPLAGLSPLMRGAAALVPIQLIAGGKAPAALAAKLIPAGGAYKLLGYLLLPAVSLLMLLVAALVGVWRIHGLNQQPAREPTSREAFNRAISKWWTDHLLASGLVWFATLAVVWIGKTWLLFSMYLGSFGLLLVVLSALARRGLGSRREVGVCCLMGLMTFAQMVGISTLGYGDIHFIDQRIVSAVFWCGVIVLTIQMAWSHGGSLARRWVVRWVSAAAITLVFAPLVVWLASPLLRRDTPARIEHFVESFDRAPNENVSWEHWAIAAQWTIDRGLDPNLSAPRRLLRAEIAGHAEARRFAYIANTLGYGLRLGLIAREDLDEPTLLAEYQSARKILFWPKEIMEQQAAQEAESSKSSQQQDNSNPGRRSPRERRPHRPRANAPSEDQDGETRPGQPTPAQIAELYRIAHLPRDKTPLDQQTITSPDATDWIIRAAALRDDLSGSDRDYLEKRLKATLDDYLTGQCADFFEDTLCVVRLLAVIGRPIEPAQYQDRVHAVLLEMHSQLGGGYSPAGGFLRYPFNLKNNPEPNGLIDRLKHRLLFTNVGRIGSVDATAYAVELMEIFGVPPTLDLNWVRSFVRATWERDLSDERWITAVTRDRLSRLPGARPESWFDVLYYERGLLAAIILVALCIYATASAPVPIEIDEVNPPLRQVPINPRIIWASLTLMLITFGLLIAILFILRRP